MKVLSDVNVSYVTGRSRKVTSFVADHNILDVVDIVASIGEKGLSTGEKIGAIWFDVKHSEMTF